MLPTAQSPAAFLLQSIAQIGFTRAGGILCGIRTAGGKIASVPASSSPSACLNMFEEMVEACEVITPPSDEIMVPLEEGEKGGKLIDLARRWHLDTYTTIDMEERAVQKEIITLVATQYRRFAPLKYLGEGEQVRIQGIQENGSPVELRLERSLFDREGEVRQFEKVGLDRASRQLDTSELSVRVARGESDRYELFDLALQLSAKIYLSSPSVFNMGFFLEVIPEETDLSFQRLLPSGMYHLAFGPEGGLLLEDERGQEIDPERFPLRGRHFTISSKARESRSEKAGPAVAVGWDRSGFRIMQRRGLGGPPSIPGVIDIFDQVRQEIEHRQEDFERLPYFERIGRLEEYYSRLRNEPRGQA